MDKKLDPLRELEAAAHNDDPPPTIELSPEQAKIVSEKMAEPPQFEKIAAPPPPSLNSISTPSTAIRQPTMQHSPSMSRLRLGEAVNIKENIAPREHIRLYGNVGPTLTLFVLGVIVAVLGIGVFKGITAPSAPGVSPVENGSKPPSFASTNLPAPEAGAFVEPLFGSYAVKRCVERCESRTGPARDLCSHGCSMYLPQFYGRRISFDKYDPLADTTEIMNRCTKREINLETHTSGSVWSEELASSIDLLEEGGETLKSSDNSRIRSYYGRLLQSNHELRLPPGGTPAEVQITKQLAQTNCLEANLALTSLALGAAQQSGDEISARYYRDLYASLEPKALEAGTQVTSLAKTLKLR